MFGRDLSKERPAHGLDGRIENPKVGVDVAKSHVYRAWGEMYVAPTRIVTPSLSEMLILP